MNLFDQLVSEAVRNQKELSPLRAVVEKELLHHDILREMAAAGLLAELTFIGGTCLRACYGSSRLSEDLDFTGGADFSRGTLAELAKILVDCLQRKYGLRATASEPSRKAGNVDTWKLTLQTRPDKRNMPAQHINIDICAIASHDPRPAMLINAYGVDMGTSGLIVQAQSREEIFADKLLAFALRPNRLKNRDLWDMAWLHQQGIVLPLPLLPLKLDDHHCSEPRFLALLNERSQGILNEPKYHEDFSKEMRRFLPAALIGETVDKESFWGYLITLIAEECKRASDFLLGDNKAPRFKM